MPQAKPVEVLQIHFEESCRYRGQPLHDALVQKCRESGIAGATVFRGVEGYGAAAEIHRERWLTHRQPIIVVIVDAPENIRRLLPSVEEMMDTGLITVSQAEAVRVERPLPA